MGGPHNDETNFQARAKRMKELKMHHLNQEDQGKNRELSSM